MLPPGFLGRRTAPTPCHFSGARQTGHCPQTNPGSPRLARRLAPGRGCARALGGWGGGPPRPPLGLPDGPAGGLPRRAGREPVRRRLPPAALLSSVPARAVPTFGVGALALAVTPSPKLGGAPVPGPRAGPPPRPRGGHPLLGCVALSRLFFAPLTPRWFPSWRLGLPPPGAPPRLSLRRLLSAGALTRRAPAPPATPLRLRPLALSQFSVLAARGRWTLSLPAVGLSVASIPAPIFPLLPPG